MKKLFKTRFSAILIALVAIIALASVSYAATTYVLNRTVTGIVTITDSGGVDTTKYPEVYSNIECTTILPSTGFNFSFRNDNTAGATNRVYVKTAEVQGTLNVVKGSDFPTQLELTFASGYASDTATYIDVTITGNTAGEYPISIIFTNSGS